MSFWRPNVFWNDPLTLAERAALAAWWASWPLAGLCALLAALLVVETNLVSPGALPIADTSAAAALAIAAALFLPLAARAVLSIVLPTRW
jgi:hypothetical protein